MAEAVLSGDEVGQVARKFKVDVSTVKHACAEHDVVTPKPMRPVGGTTLEILSELLRGVSGSVIAKARGVSRQRVDLVKRAAKAAGIAVP